VLHGFKLQPVAKESGSDSASLDEYAQALLPIDSKIILLPCAADEA
jgi:hypothetical protein